MHTMNEAGSNNVGGEGGEGRASGPRHQSERAEETRRPGDKAASSGAAYHVTPIPACFLERRQKMDEVVV